MKKKPSLLKLLSQPRTESRPERLYPFPDLWVQEHKPALRNQESDEEEEIDDLNTIPRLYRNKNDEWGPEETRKWIENRKKRFPIPANIQKLKNEDEDDNDVGTMERKLRMRLELLKGNDESEYLLRKRARYLKELATVQRIKRKAINPNPQLNQNNNTDQNVEETPNPTHDPSETPIPHPDDPCTITSIKQRRVDSIQPRTRDEITAHLKLRVDEDDTAIRNFVNNKTQHSSNYRYIQNTLFSNLVIDDVLQERDNIMSIVEYIHENNYLQD